MAIKDLQGASAGNSRALRTALLELDNRLSAMETAQSPTGSTAVKPPQTNAQMISVTGKDGKFIIEITPPAQYSPQTTQAKRNYIDDNAYDYDITPAALYIKVQSSKTLEFDATGEVVTYGPTNQTHLEDQRPNEYRYFRFTMSYDQKNWAPWLPFNDPLVCGPAHVWSQLLRTAANALVNSAATTTDGTNPITQDGTTTNILIAGKDWNVGPEVIHYNGGHVNPGSYGTFQISLDDPDKSGGNVTYQAWDNNGPLTAADGRLWIGLITTAAGGGGTGSGGGGGGGCTVLGSLYKRMDGSATPVEQLRKGDTVMGMDGGPEVLQKDPEQINNQPVFELVTANGKRTKGFSSTQDVGFDGGGFDKVFGFKVGDRIWTEDGPSEISSKTFLGMRTVYKVVLDRTKTMIIDGIGCHNKMSSL